MALSLGRITVHSALGEPLRAEIEVPDINAEEAASLRTVVALPEAFAAAGLEYNPALSSLQATLQRRADGRIYIRLTSDRPIDDPFVDMIMEASWSSGRIVRDYTMLFDPPSLVKPATVAPTLPQIAAQAVIRPATPDYAAQPKPEASRPTNQGKDKVVIQPGDTASKVAANARENGVSLDQMLVAMLRGNPDAFINNNIHRIRSGAVINVPTSDQAKSVAASEATRILRAESQDFGSFKRALASNAPATTVAAADRKAGGTIESKVVDGKLKAATPDKLTLSKGAVQAKMDEAKLTQERAAKDEAARTAEIAKNISDLKKAGADVAAVAAPTVVDAAAPAAASVAVTATPAALAVQVPAPVASAPIKPPASPVLPVEESSLLDNLLEDPILPIAGIGLLALLGGFGFYRIRQRKKNAAQVDSSFLESRLQPDSFFGASGGQRVDTNNEAPASSGSSLVYSASQLDAADDVDPVAEADVYLAYGRDMQAEEILKEAVRTNPGRLAIYTKLLEIFAKRRDANNFEATAIQASKLTGNESLEWARVCDMGLDIDPVNPLYQPGGVSAAANPATALTAANTNASSSASNGVSKAPHSTLPELAQGNSVDFDLNLNLSPIEAAAEQPEVSMPASPSRPNFSAAKNTSVNYTVLPTLQKDPGMLEFDMSSLSLDLESSSASGSLMAASDTSGEGPLETKLALAEEFVSIGDEDGARALIEEVVAEATGDMRAKAQRALANLS